jgi:single-stranded DNA-binding protein
MTQNLLENNQITIIGEVAEECQFSHELYGEKFYEFKIEVTRLSDQTDILPVTMSERLINKDELTKGTPVEIKGQIRSYNNKNETGNKLKLNIFARDVVANITREDHINPNEVYLNGFLCKSPIYRTTPFGREICDVILAVNRSYRKSDYIPIITWGRNARFSENLKIGDNVKITGRLQSREYDKKLPDGTVIKKTAYEISVSKMEVDVENNNKVETEITEA